MTQSVYTIGHSTHSIEEFIRLLQEHNITCVIDVRSMPYSQYNPQFNKELLQAELYNHEIVYAHFGKEFGARHTKPSLLNEDGRVDFNKVRETEDFKRGIRRLDDALDQGYHVALLCSEGNPLDCHRFSMISYQLVREGYEVIHIMPDGDTVTNDELEKQMLEKYLPQPNFFDQVTPEGQLETAYQLISKKVAYRASQPSVDDSEEE
jgi:uncharacterized protein (DUF488 family)